MQSRPESEPQDVLLSRPGWAEGWASAASGREVVTQWVATAIWNAMGIPIAWIAFFGDKDLGLPMTVGLVAFAAVGILLLVFAVRGTLRWRRFGKLRIELDPQPGSLGEHVGGTIELPVHQLDETSIRVLLLCINDRLVETSDGSGRRESIGWAAEVIPKIERSGSGVRIRFTLEIPPDLPPTTAKSDDYIKWVVRVQAELPGADLDQTFEVPVLQLDPVRHAASPALASPTTAADALVLSDTIVRVRRQRGGLTLYYPVGRGGYAGIMLLIFGAVFAGMGTFFFSKTVSMMDGSVFAIVFMIFSSGFLVVFGGVGGLIMLLGLYSLVNSLVVEIRNGKISTRRWFFLPFKRSARLEDVERVEMDVSSRMGDGAKAERKVRVRAFLKGGKRLCLGDDVPWGQPSEALAGLLSAELGMPVDFVHNARLGLKK